MMQTIKRLLLGAMALCHGILFSAVVPGTPFSCCPDICVDFSNLAPGDKTAAINAKLPGITFSTNNPQGLVVFNSTNPTCNQFALGSPNGFAVPGGKGVGSGGAIGPCINNKSLGNVLVMASNNPCQPSATSAGGTITLVFDCPVILDQVCVLNVCDSSSNIKMFDSNNVLLSTKPFFACGTNGFQTLMLSQNGVKRLEVNFTGMSALSCICFRCEVVDEAARSCCEFLSSIVSGLVTCCDVNSSIINTLETRVDALETCCEQNTTAIEALQTCCEENSRSISVLDICCANAQSRLEQLECPRCCPEICLDFVKFASGANQATINAGLCGISISGVGNNCPGCQAFIYDTDNPDIADSNPGTKVLIVSDGNPLRSNLTGGVLTFTFQCPVSIDVVNVLDIDAPSSIRLFDASNTLLAVVPVPQEAPAQEGLVVPIPVNQPGVSRMTINLATTGGIASVCFHCEVIDTQARSCCDNAQSRIALLETCCDENTSIINILETRVAQLQTCCDANILCCSLVERQINNLISIVDRDIIPIDNLQSCCDSNTSRIARLETCCDTNSRSISILDLCCANAQSRLERLEFPNCCPFCLNFNLAGLQPGDTQAVINSKLVGVQITAVGFNGGGAMIYDSSDPAGINHADIGTPNDKHGGPGQEENIFDTNNVARGNVLIINDNVPPLKQSADLRGGSITFTFTCAVMVDSLGILDIEAEDQPASITLFDPNNNIIAVIPIPTLHDNGFQTIAINTPNVSRMVVTYHGDAAITDLCFHCEVIDLAARSCCEFLSSIVATIETRIDNLESCCEGNTTRIENLESCCEGNTTRIENLESCCEEVRSRLEALECQCCPKRFCIDFSKFTAGDTEAFVNSKLCGVQVHAFAENCIEPSFAIVDVLPFTGGQPFTPAQFMCLTTTTSFVFGKMCSNGAESSSITIDFEKCPVVLEKIGVSSTGGTAILIDTNGNPITSISFGPGQSNIIANQPGVQQVQINFSPIGEFAAAGSLVCFCYHCEVIDEAARSCCETINSILEFQQTQIDTLISCCDNHTTRIENLESCCEGNTTRIENLESCCEEVRSRLEALECQCCPKRFCIDFSQFSAGDSESFVNSKLCGVEVHAIAPIICEPPIQNVIDITQFFPFQPITPEQFMCLTQTTSLVFGQLCDGMDEMISATITIDFKKCPVLLEKIGVASSGGNATLLDTNGQLIKVVPFAAGFTNIIINQPGVQHVILNFTPIDQSPGAGALVCFCYHCEVIDEAARSCCETLSSIISTFETRIENLESCCEQNTACCSAMEAQAGMIGSIVANLESRLDIINASCCNQICLDFTNLKGGDMDAAIASKIKGITFTGFLPSETNCCDQNSTCTQAGLIAINIPFLIPPVHAIFVKDPNNAGNPNPDGGQICAAFDCPVILQTVQIYNLSDTESVTLTAYDINDVVLQTIVVPGAAFTVQTADFNNLPGVKKLQVITSGVSGIQQLCFACPVVDNEARSCCEQLSSIVGTFETRIENLESCCEQNSNAISILEECCAANTTCCENLTSRIEALECPTCCPKEFCIDFDQFAAGTPGSVVAAELCGIQSVSGSVVQLCSPVKLSCISKSTNKVLSANPTIVFDCPIVLDTIGMRNDCIEPVCPPELLCFLSAIPQNIILRDSNNNIIGAPITFTPAGPGSSEITVNRAGVKSIQFTGNTTNHLVCLCFHCETVDTTARSLIENLESCCENHETRIERLESCCELTKSLIEEVITGFGTADLVFTPVQMTNNSSTNPNFQVDVYPGNSPGDKITMYGWNAHPSGPPQDTVTIQFEIPADFDSTKPVEVDMHFLVVDQNQPSSVCDAPLLPGARFARFKLQADFKGNCMQMGVCPPATGFAQTVFTPDVLVVEPRFSCSSSAEFSITDPILESVLEAALPLQNVMHEVTTFTLNGATIGPRNYAFLAFSRVALLDAMKIEYDKDVYFTVVSFRYGRKV